MATLKTSDLNLSSLEEWAQSQLKEQAIIEPDAELEFNPLGGDASFRRYFRLHAPNKQSWILAFAPPETEKNHEFIDIANRLASAGVHAPVVIAADTEQGLLLLSDLGDALLQDALNLKTVEDLYGQAMDLCFQMQQVDADSLPGYDDTLLMQEMRLFTDWFVPQLLGHQLTGEEQALNTELFSLLSRSAQEQPQGFVHRDYHSRNIMLVKKDQNEPELAAIDFQDAVKGPVTYDLVSLLRDCYIHWAPADVDRWVEGYYQSLVDQNVIDEGISSDQFLCWFDWMGLQRHIKVLGIFARLSIRDHKNAYLMDLPLVIHYTRTVMQQYKDEPVITEWLKWFDTTLMPIIMRQSWYRRIEAVGQVLL